MVSEGKTSLADLYVCTKAVAKSIKSEHGLSRLTSASGVGQGQRRQKQKGLDVIQRCSARNAAAGVRLSRVMNRELAAFIFLYHSSHSLIHYCAGFLCLASMQRPEDPSIMVVKLAEHPHFLQ